MVLWTGRRKKQIMYFIQMRYRADTHEHMVAHYCLTMQSLSTSNSDSNRGRDLHLSIIKLSWHLNMEHDVHLGIDRRRGVDIISDIDNLSDNK